MNRKEAVERIQKFYDWNFGDEEYDQETERNHKQNLEDIIEYLKQPITLNDFFNFEENVEYELNGIVYKVCNNNLFYSSPFINNWLICLKFQDLEELRKRAERKNKKYNLILKSGYRKLFDLQNNEKYLTICIQDRDVFHSKYSTDNSKYQAQFTLNEIEDIKIIYDIDLCIYNIVEV